MSKCEWKELKMDDKPVGIFGRLEQDGSFSFQYKKPEPEQPIIKRSGETWVALFDGVDYLWFDNDEPKYNGEFFQDDLKMSRWVVISEIEITDKIAKLRPMITAGSSCTYKLWGCDVKSCIIGPSPEWISIEHIKLATVEEL